MSIRIILINTVCLFIFCTGCWANKLESDNRILDGKVELGEKYFPNSEDSIFQLLLPTGDFSNAVDIKSKGCKFSVGFDEENTIVIISTNDKFFTIDELTIGSVLNAPKANRVKNIRGWGKVYPLNYGWYAGFINYEVSPEKNQGINWFFKYNFKR